MLHLNKYLENLKKNLGLHVRIFQDSTIQFLEQYNFGCIQTFLIHEDTRQYIDLSNGFYHDFKHALIQFSKRYAHASYYVNLCHPQKNNLRIILKELEIASYLGFDYLIVHPGCYPEKEFRNKGLLLLGQNLNFIETQKFPVKIILENTAHAGGTIGSDLNDFIELKEFLVNPDKLLFCFDTAHAYASGIDINDENIIKSSLELIDQKIGYNALQLIHLNSTDQELGSRIDKHLLPGEGSISFDALSSLAKTMINRDINVILEAPKNCFYEEILNSIEKLKGVLEQI